MLDYNVAYAKLNDLCKRLNNESFDKVFPIFRKELLDLSNKCEIDGETLFTNWMKQYCIMEDVDEQ